MSYRGVERTLSVFNTGKSQTLTSPFGSGRLALRGHSDAKHSDNHTKTDNHFRVANGGRYNDIRRLGVVDGSDAERKEKIDDTKGC